jgi:hypothetical protein
MPEETATEEVAEETTTEEMVEEVAVTEEVSEEEAVEEVPKKQTAQERIDEITWKFREAERQANYWKKLASEEPRPAKEEAESTDILARPVIDNFETTAEYEDALFGWYDKKRVDADKVKAHTKTVKENIGVFNKNAAEFKKTHKDFSKVIEAPVFTDTMRNVLFTMEGGPEIAYHIAKNPQVGSEFGKLSPTQQIFKIAEIRNEIKLAHSTRTITGASEPIEPVGDTGHQEKDPDKMTTEEWMAWNKKRDMAMLEKKIGENR